MGKRTVRLLLTLTFGLACTTWSPAQDEDLPSKKKPVSKEIIEARAKVSEARRGGKASDRAKARAEALAKATDLNHATKDELMKVRGISEAYAAAIIAKRPYKTKADLVSKNVLPMSVYMGLHDQVAAK